MLHCRKKIGRMNSRLSMIGFGPTCRTELRYVAFGRGGVVRGIGISHGGESGGAVGHAEQSDVASLGVNLATENLGLPFRTKLRLGGVAKGRRSIIYRPRETGERMWSFQFCGFVSRSKLVKFVSRYALSALRRLSVVVMPFWRRRGRV